MPRWELHLRKLANVHSFRYKFPALFVGGHVLPFSADEGNPVRKLERVTLEDLDVLVPARYPYFPHSLVQVVMDAKVLPRRVDMEHLSFVAPAL
jgi:hypothetical protein